jgi:hypothetical protein
MNNKKNMKIVWKKEKMVVIQAGGLLHALYSLD